MYKKYLCIILLIFISLALVSCRDGDSFQSAYEQFSDSYYKATSFCDLDEIQLEALKKLDPEKVSDELENMRNALDVLHKNMKTESEKRAYRARKSDYEDLLYLVNNYNKYDSSSDDEKMEIENKLFGVYINRHSISMNKEN